MRNLVVRTVFTLFSLIGSFVCSTSGQPVQPTLYETTGSFAGDHLRESSGIAVSHSQPGILWTHNDSGDRARIYAVNLEAHELGVFRVRGAEARDWEDIALGPCPEERHEVSCIYIADTGDNQGTRTRGVIYIVTEPNLDAVDSATEATTDLAHALRVSYPDGPRDIEAMGVTPLGDILLITKGTRGPVMLYRIPARMTGSRSAQATAVDTLPILPARRFGNLVTGAAVSADGNRLAVRTYTQLYFFAPSVNGSWQLSQPACWVGLRQPQGEAVDFLDEATVVLSSESAMGRRGGLARVKCPIGDVTPS